MNKQEKFLQKVYNKHSNKYDYSLVNYINSRTKIKIICKIHGVFEQEPANHVRGQGCPDCLDKKVLPFDFYLIEYNICIEYDGLQHFRAIEYFGGEKTLKITKKHDNIKNEYCLENGIKLYRIRYNQDIKKELSNILNSLSSSKSGL